MTSKPQIIPVTHKRAAAHVQKHHRHHGVPRGFLWTHGVEYCGRLCGVAFVGRPVARALNDGLSIEVNRVCTLPEFGFVDRYGVVHAPPFNSMLYRAAERTARAMGYIRGLTYLLASEWDVFDESGKRTGGAGVRSAGWLELWRVDGRSWNCESRPRTDNHPTEDKVALGFGDWSAVAAYRRHNGLPIKRAA